MPLWSADNPEGVITILQWESFLHYPRHRQGCAEPVIANHRRRADRPDLVEPAGRQRLPLMLDIAPSIRIFADHYPLTSKVH